MYKIQINKPTLVFDDKKFMAGHDIAFTKYNNKESHLDHYIGRIKEIPMNGDYIIIDDIEINRYRMDKNDMLVIYLKDISDVNYVSCD